MWVWAQVVLAVILLSFTVSLAIMAVFYAMAFILDKLIAFFRSTDAGLRRRH